MKGARSKGAAKADTKLAVKSKRVEKPAKGRGRKGKAGKDPNKPKRDWLAPPMAKAPRCSPPWSDIPLDLACQVLHHIPAQVDLVRFAAVCPQWRVAGQQLPLPPPPAAALALDGGTLYILPRVERFCFPDYGGRYHSTCGNWLVFSRDDGFFLVDPFSKATMTLPGLSCVQPDDESDDEPDFESDDESDVEKLIWMTIEDPNELVMHKLIVCSPHLVAALVGIPDFGENQIVVCRPGASSWSVRAHDPFTRLRGMAFHQGDLYVLDSNNNLLAVDIRVDHSTGDPWVSRTRLVIKARGALLPGLTDDMTCEGDDDILTMLYLVESHGALLMVRRKFRGRRTSRYGRSVFVPTNSEFKVFEANFGRSRWNKVTTVGDDQVLFLARWSSRAVSVSKHGMPGNRIFFWDDDLYHDAWLIHHDREIFSCSAYDMGDGTVSSPLPMISWNHGMMPTTWGEFTSWKRGMVPPTWLFPRD